MMVMMVVMMMMMMIRNEPERVPILFWPDVEHEVPTSLKYTIYHSVGSDEEGGQQGQANGCVWPYVYGSQMGGPLLC